MAKRRTRKEKESIKRTNLISWKPSALNSSSRDVKGQPNVQLTSLSIVPIDSKKSTITDETIYFELSRKNIIKSLLVFGVIIGIEVVLYFIA